MSSPLDEVLIDEEDTKKSEKGFDWLNDIVEEETGAMAPVVPKPTPPPAAPVRFKFSKRPAWLEKLLGNRTSASASTAQAVDDDDDFDFDSTGNDYDDDDEFPDWLDVDDD